MAFQCSAIEDQKWRVEAQQSGEPRIVRRADADFCTWMASTFTDANDSTLRHAEGEGLLAVQVMRFLMASNCEKTLRPTWIPPF